MTRLGGYIWLSVKHVLYNYTVIVLLYVELFCTYCSYCNYTIHTVYKIWMERKQHRKSYTGHIVRKQSLDQWWGWWTFFCINNSFSNCEIYFFNVLNVSISKIWTRVAAQITRPHHTVKKHATMKNTALFLLEMMNLVD